MTTKNICRIVYIPNITSFIGRIEMKIVAIERNDVVIRFSRQEFFSLYFAISALNRESDTVDLVPESLTEEEIYNLFADLTDISTEIDKR